MDSLLRLGRFFFAISVAAFGSQYILYGQLRRGLPPVPPWTLGGAPLAYFTGVVLVAAAIGIAANWKPRFSAALVGFVFVFCAVFLHGLHASAILRSGDARTGAFEALSIGAAAFVLAGILPVERSAFHAWDIGSARFIQLGRYLFAFSMLVFGVQHFMYADYIATLVTPWIPAHLFWVYFTGVGFIAAALCIAINKFSLLAATWLGIMFLLWVLVLHAPRVAAALHNGDEWASLLVALAMSGGSFIIAQAASKAD
jgi:uncharacterized membrane protein